MQIIKTLFYNFVSFITSGQPEPEAAFNRASLNEESVIAAPEARLELPPQTEKPIFDFAATSLGEDSAGQSASEPYSVPATTSKVCQQLQLAHAFPLAVIETSRYLGRTKQTVNRSKFVLLYAERRQYTQAKPLFFRLLSIRDQGLDANQRYVADSLHNLGLTYFKQGQNSLAEPVFKRSLGIRERMLAPDHPDVALSLHYLGCVYLNIGLYSLAETQFRRCLALREQILGADHPELAESLGGLAAVFAAKGCYDQAEPLYSRALVIYDKTDNANHPLRRLTSENLALVRRFKG